MLGVFDAAIARRYKVLLKAYQLDRGGLSQQWENRGETNVMSIAIGRWTTSREKMCGQKAALHFPMPNRSR